jgi:hypothetical protein
MMDRRPRMASAIVTGGFESGGLVDLPHDVTFERDGATATGHAGPGRSPYEQEAQK